MWMLVAERTLVNRNKHKCDFLDVSVVCSLFGLVLYGVYFAVSLIRGPEEKARNEGS